MQGVHGGSALRTRAGGVRRGRVGEMCFGGEAGENVGSTGDQIPRGALEQESYHTVGPFRGKKAGP